MITDPEFDLSAYGTPVEQPSASSQPANSGFYQLTFTGDDADACSVRILAECGLRDA